MTTIRTFRRGVATAESAPDRISPNVSPDAFGAEVSRAIAQAGGQLRQLGGELFAEEEKEQIRVDRSTTRDVLNKGRQEDGDFMNTLFSKKGGEAKTSFEDAKEYFRKQRNFLPKDLDNQRQKDLFYDNYDSFVERNLGSARTHQSREMENYEKATLTAQQRNATEDAFIYRDDPEEVLMSKTEMRVAVRDQWEHMGAEVLERELRKANTQFDVRLIGGYLADENIEKAREYFDDNKKEMSSEVRVKIENSLKFAGAKKESQFKADEIVGSGEDYQQQLDSARAIENPDVRDQTVQRIKVRHQEINNIKTEARRVLVDGKTNDILNAPTAEQAMDIANSVEAADYTGKGSDRASLTRFAQSLYKPPKETSNFSLVNQARIGIDDGRYTSEAQLLRDIRPVAKDSDLREIIKYFRQGGAKGALKEPMVRRHFKTIGGKSIEDAPEQYNDVWNYVVDNVKEGAAPTDENIRKLVSNALVEGEVESGKFYIRDEDMSFAEATATGKVRNWFPEVTDQEEKDIIQILKKAGKLVNPETIRLYKKHIILGAPLASDQIAAPLSP